jgi:tryptophanyl-tRNA synthetase
MIKQEIIVSGIRASGQLHVGNYLGALKQFTQLQNDEKYHCYFFIADLHAITTPFEPKELKQNTLDVAADYLAAGLDPKKCTFFIQSQVLEHAQLAWIFNCLLPIGELFRMTQFKEKERDLEKNITLPPSKNLDTGEEILPTKTYTVKGVANAGLLTYPALMAADILMYKATAVPVGEDQVQHVELARVVARKFNHRFGKTFSEPKTFLREPLRIMSLTDPTKKMSKTGDESLLLDDSPQEIHRKLKKAVTATEAGKKSPGEKNLMLLLSHFGKDEEVRYFTQAQASGSLRYSELKEALAKNISDYFEQFREKKKLLLSKPNYLAEVLGEGSAKAHAIAKETLMEVKEKVGLI